MIKPILTPILTIAALMTMAAAPAQRVDGEFRMMWIGKDAASFVTTKVTGPSNARNLTEVIVRAERAPSGTDVYAIDTIADCDAQTLSIGDVIAYQDGKVLNRIPATQGEVSPVERGTRAWLVYDYACTGKAPTAEAERPNGVNAVVAYGRKRLGLD